MSVHSHQTHDEARPTPVLTEGLDKILSCSSLQCDLASNAPLYIQGKSYLLH